jgi:hypothetical protein
MKCNFNIIFHSHFLIILILINFSYQSNLNSNFKFSTDSLRDNPKEEPKSEDSNDIKKVLKEKKHLEKSLKKLKKMIKQLEINQEELFKKNDNLKTELNHKNKLISDMKKNLAKLKEENSNGGSNGNVIKEVKSILSGMSEFKGLLHQVEMSNIQEKEMKREFIDKLDQISTSQKKIDEVYNDLNLNYKEKFNSLLNNVNKIQNQDEKIKQKLFFIEKEKEKTSMTRKLKKEGKFNQHGTLIEPSCVNRNSCRTCLEDSQCVWCAKTRQCVQGDIYGPYDGRCNKQGEFSYSKCEPNFCEQFSNCTQCIENVSCGWCSKTNSCMDGNERQPIGLLCPSKEYFHKMKQGRCGAHSSYFLK